jgi:hypothetical protein
MHIYASSEIRTHDLNIRADEDCYTLDRAATVIGGKLRTTTKNKIKMCQF